ncbi:MAG: DUF465 domain-containing protein [Pseudomonadota bacterium]
MEYDQKSLEKRLSVLVREHQGLDAAIAERTAAPPFNQIEVQRLKKQKLQLRDEITRLEDLLIPDIIA